MGVNLVGEAKMMKREENRIPILQTIEISNLYPQYVSNRFRRSTGNSLCEDSACAETSCDDRFVFKSRNG